MRLHARPLLPSALAAAVALLLDGTAAAQAPTSPSPQAAPAPEPVPAVQTAPPPAEERLPLLGLMVDVGVPDGLGASAVVRPLDWLRLSGGVVTNTVGVGLRVGASVAPFRAFVTPSLNVDLGHYFEGDYSKLPARLGSEPGSAAQAALTDVGYTFGSASLGVELGSQRGLSFFLRAGLSYWDFTPADAEQALRDAADDPTLEVAPVSLRFSSPSIKLGFTLFL